MLYEADMILEKEMRVLQVDPWETGSELVTGCSWSIGDLKVSTHNYTLPPHLLVLPLLLGTIFSPNHYKYHSSNVKSHLEEYRNGAGPADIQH